MNVYVLELSGALARAGVDCDVYTRAWKRGLPEVAEVEPGVRVHHVRAGPARPLAKEELPALVGEFTARARGSLVARRPDVIHANYWLSGVAGHALKHDLELPLVSTFHTLSRVKAEAALEEEAPRARAETDVIGCSDAILASSADEAAQLERLYGADPSRVEIVPPGVDHDVFCPGDKALARAHLGLGAGPVLLFAGRIQPLKGVDVAVQTLAALRRPATLVVVGGPSGRDGQRESRHVRALVGDLGLDDRVRFVAPQPHRDLADYYRAADVCLVPSRSESFGLVAIEAAACGTPVVAASVGGLRTLVAHDRTGYLIEGRDPTEYADHVRRLLDDPALAARMGAAAAREARSYCWSIAAAKLRRIYADLTARRPVECG